MIDVRINRIVKRDDVTLGVLYLPGERFNPLVTLEEPWRDNQPHISCIPAGIYRCVPHNGPKFKNVWRLEDVPGRSAILIHAGNTTRDIEGCILLGTSFGEIAGMPAVLGSRTAVDLFRKRIGVTEKFLLTIT